MELYNIPVLKNSDGSHMLRHNFIDQFKYTQKVMVLPKYLIGKNRKERLVAALSNRPNDITVMLDNGVYEDGLLDFELLVKLAIEIKTDYLIVPDVFQNYNENLSVINDFLNFYSKKRSNIYKQIGLIGVAQGTSAREIVNSIKYLNGVKEIRKIALPKVIDTDPRYRLDTNDIKGIEDLDSFSNRDLITEYFKYEKVKQFHYLGYGTFPSNKAYFYNQTSIDTAVASEYAYYDNNETVKTVVDKIKGSERAVYNIDFEEVKLETVDSRTKKIVERLQKELRN